MAANGVTKAVPKGVKKVTGLLEHLTQHPRLKLGNTVKGLKLSLASKNDHFAARHFAKEDLPRIRYSNPNLLIEVTKWPKLKTDQWRPELEVILENDKSVVLDMSQSSSSSILKQLVDGYGGEPWKAAAAEAERTGTSLISESKIQRSSDSDSKLPNLWQFLTKNPQRKAAVEKEWAEKRENKDKVRQAAKPTAGSTQEAKVAA